MRSPCIHKHMNVVLSLQKYFIKSNPAMVYIYIYIIVPLEWDYKQASWLSKCPGILFEEFCCMYLYSHIRNLNRAKSTTVGFNLIKKVFLKR